MPALDQPTNRFNWSRLGQVNRQLSWWALASWLALAVALVQDFRSEGRHRHSVYIALIVPFVRILVDPAFRRSLQNRFRNYTADIHTYAQSGIGFPFEAILVLVMLPVAILNLSSNVTGGNGDTWPVMATSSSIVREGNLEIAEYLSSYIVKDAAVPYCVIQTPDGYYSSYPAGMNFFAVPVCAAARVLGADLSSFRVRWRLEKWTATWVAALCMGLFFAIAVRIADLQSAAIATVFLASGSAMLSTVGHGLWQHGGVIFWALLALALEFSQQGIRRDSRTLLEGVALGMMLSCRLSAGLIVAAIALWIGLRSVRHGLILTVGFALGALPWALLYATVYGSPLGPSQVQMAGSNWGGVEFIAPVLFSPGAGLLVYQPWMALLLLLPALWAIGFQLAQVERAIPPRWMWLCWSIVVMHVVLVARWKCWWGGSCWGSRLCTEAMPFAALLCLAPIAYLRERRWGMVLLLLLGLASAFLHIYVNYFREGFYRPVEDLMNWSRAPFLPTFQ